MARRLSTMSAELASWSNYYLSRDQDLHGTQLYGRLSDRAVFLDHVVTKLDEVIELLRDMPRTS